MHHEQDIFRMGGVRRTAPLIFWAFLAGALCLAGFPLTGGFFSKDAVLAAAWAKGGALYGGLYMLGLVTAFLTALYTFRLVYLVFGGNSENKIPPLRKADFNSEPIAKVPRLMEMTLLPLAVVGLLGGAINIPEYMGHGWLSDLFAPMGGGVPPEITHTQELALQAIAGTLCLAGLAVAHFRYGGTRRLERISAAEKPLPALAAFCLNGWYFDAIYRLLFIRPYEALSRFLWQRVDEGVIDDSLDRLAGGVAQSARFMWVQVDERTIDASLDRLSELTGRAGERLGRWTSGRISVYILSFAAGAVLILAYLAWVVYST
jgi:NADH-quinone oxidoreductase subunit L